MLRDFSLSLLLFYFLALPHKAWACSFKEGLEVLSFSGPVTTLLEELALLKDPALKAVSTFHPVETEKIKKIAGGIFVSPKVLSQFNEPVIFFDQSSELEKALSQNKFKKLVEITTRDMDPFAANQAALEAINPFLEGCSNKVKSLKDEMKKIKAAWKKINLPPATFVFYLGSFKKGQRPPELVIANDGFVKFFKKQKKARSYPGNLAYLPWSKKILSRLKNPAHIGIHESEKEGILIERVEEGVFNIGYKGVLTPGIRQALFLKSLVDSDFFGKFL
ncbi:MAG: hypothetical protein WD025_00700 [Bacteriovoracaceae bacterium]